jgi:sulfide dehydrogenase cytochrome subunit
MKPGNTLAVALAALGLTVAAPLMADTYTSGAATLSHPGRLLASNCFQCHGTNGHGMESLAGKSASSIAEEMYEMRMKPVGADMMHVHAQGYTTTQTNQIANYFSRQQP